MYFLGTRGSERVTGAEALVRGIARDGGLFVPESFPAVTEEEFTAMLGMDYSERAALLLSKYFDEYDKEELLSELNKAYDRFDTEDAAPLVRIDDGVFMLELFHGPTCTAKDMALTVLPYLIGKGCKLTGVKEKLLVVSATGGDTGKAVIEGFKDADGVKVMTFYPEEGVSKMQKLQMCTVESGNVDVVAVRGSFDDCQTGMKKVLTSEESLNKIRESGYHVTSVNSVNIGRIALQIVCYFSAYCDLVSSEQIEMGEPVDFSVPTGNFGNLLAGYYAKRMGLPVGKLICASNRNNALTHFFANGTYDSKRTLIHTMSPSMDVLLPANLERLLFEVSGRDAQKTSERMKELAAKGKYSVTQEELKALKKDIFAAHASEDDTVESIYEFFCEYGYPMDTHTGVAVSAVGAYHKTLKEKPKEKNPVVVIATASPYVFPQDVLYALTGNDVKDSFKGLKRINLLTAMKVPECLKEVRYKPLLFKQVVSPDKMFSELQKFVQE